MGFKEILTPNNTEEVKPNLFIQKKGEHYKVIQPLVWNGKFRIKEQLKTIFSLRVLLGLVFTLFLVWTYLHDIGALRDFYFKIHTNPITWCSNVLASVPVGDICTKQWEEYGLCETNTSLQKIYSANLSNWSLK